MLKWVLSKKRMGILLLLLFTTASTTLLLSHTCHIPAEDQTISTQVSHFHKDGVQHVHNVVSSAPKVLESLAGELCVGLFLLVLLVGRKYQLYLHIFIDSFQKLINKSEMTERLKLARKLPSLTLPQLGLLRI